MRAVWVLGLVLGLGCSPGSIELSVDVRTDLAPGTDFASARVELQPLGQGPSFEPVTRAASAADPYWQGVRVADFAGLAQGKSRVRASLLDASGEEVVGRDIELEIDGSYALTVFLSAGCVGVTCPGSSEPSSFTQCLSGRCVAPGCHERGDPRACGDLACTTQADCGALDCVAACVAGACVCAGGPLDGSVPLSDAGPSCPGECTPGATEEDTQACGECGEGRKRRTRTCTEDCEWGAFSDFAPCETDAQCSPGDTEGDTVDCGNCGTQDRTRACNGETCRWDAWVDSGGCAGQGVCRPGQTRTGCDRNSAGGATNCGVEVCSPSCTWGGCQLAPGAECRSGRGTIHQCCTPSGGGAGWQYCDSSTCQWNPCAAHSC